MVQLSHLYMTPGKTIALTIWTFVGKVATLLFNTLSRFVRTFFPRSKRLLSKRPGPQHWHIFYFSRWYQIVFQSVCTNLLSKSESVLWLLHIYANIWYRPLNFYQCKVRNMKSALILVIIHISLKNKDVEPLFMFMGLLGFLLTWYSFPGGASGKEPACQCRRQKRSS